MIFDRLSKLHGLVLAVGVGFWVINSGAVDKLLANGVLGYSAVISALEWLRKPEDKDGDGKVDGLEQRLRDLVIAQARDQGQAIVERLVDQARDQVQSIAPMTFNSESLDDWVPDLQPDVVQLSAVEPVAQPVAQPVVQPEVEPISYMTIEAVRDTTVTRLMGLLPRQISKGTRWSVTARSALGLWEGAPMTVTDSEGSEWLGNNSDWDGVVV